MEMLRQESIPFCLPFALSITRYSFSPMADCKELSISFAYLSTHWHALTHAKDPIQLSSSSCYVLLIQCPLLSLTNSRTSYSENTSVKVDLSWFHQIYLVFVLLLYISTTLPVTPSLYIRLKIECLRSFSFELTIFF